MVLLRCLEEPQGLPASSMEEALFNASIRAHSLFTVQALLLSHGAAV